jgi:hypothetical protein
MNPPGSREELEAMGFTLERRTTCKAEPCGATLEWWRAPSGRWVPFRLHPRTGKLIQHSDECPGKYQFRGKRAEEKPAPEKPKPEPKKKAEPVVQGSLF